jgi:hypothetical protein
MLDRSIRTVGIAIFLICLLGPGTAFATLKCQCNNGVITEDVGADFGDDDAEDSCNDACDEFGGGRVWRLDEDREFIDNPDGGSQPPAENRSPRR